MIISAVMSKNKLQKFAEMYEFDHVYQNFSFKKPQLITKDKREVELRGLWQEVHFKNKNPITLELACGKGEYTVGLAASFPERNFIGIDIKGARMWRGARRVKEQQLSNAAFLRTRIELITEFFEKGEVDEIWITFPDPFPKDRDENNRLTSPAFLERYRKVLKKGGKIHLKTDSDSLYAYSCLVPEFYEPLQLIEKNDDIYHTDGELMRELEIKTFYEKMHLENGKRIKYALFLLN